MKKLFTSLLLVLALLSSAHAADRLHAHSFGTASGATDTAHGYPALLAGMLGTTFDNTSHGGDMVGDQLKFAYARTYGAGDRTIIDLGLNDHGWNGINSTKLAAFKDQLNNLIGRTALAITHTAQSFGGETGVWNNTGLPGSFGRGTTAPGATKSFSCTKAVAGIAFVAVLLVDNGGGATYDVLKNGTLIGTYSSNAPVQTYATSNYPYGVRLHRIPGCNSGDTATIRNVSGNLYYEWAADNNQTAKPEVYWVNIVKSLLYDRTAIPGFQVTSEANGQAYSDAGAAVVADWVADGFPVKVVDLRSVFNTATHLHSDGLHPNNAGHLLEAQTIYSSMTGGTPPPTVTYSPLYKGSDGLYYTDAMGAKVPTTVPYKGDHGRNPSQRQRHHRRSRCARAIRSRQLVVR